MIYRAGQIRPSFQQGFARSRSESAYPELWNGLVGAWSPSLGHQGLTTLKDWSGFNRDATLNGSMNNADWIANAHGVALDFDGSNDYCSVANILPSYAGSQSIYIRFRANSVTVANRPQLIIFGQSSGDFISQFIVGVNIIGAGPSEGTAALCFIDYNAGISGCYSSQAITTNVWYSVVGLWDGAAYRLFINGVEDTNAEGTQDAPATAANMALTLAANAAGTARFWDGPLSDVALYYRALRPQEIMALHLGASPLTLKRRVYGKVPVAAGARPRLIDGRLVNHSLLLRGLAA